MLKNFVWQREDEPQNALTYVFLLINLVYGITFAFYPGSEVVQNSAFAHSQAYLPPQLWGITCLLLVAGTLYTIYKRPKVIGAAMGMIGFMAWLYSFSIYFQEATQFTAFAVYLPNMLFWVFWFIGVQRYFKREDE